MFVIATCSVVGCNHSGAISWSGGSRFRAPTATFSSECCLPTVKDAAAALSNVHIHIVGDSTLRMPVQYFGASWMGCPAAAPAHPLCQRHIHKFTPVFDRPMSGLALTFEYNRYVSDVFRSDWWRRWVASDAFRRASSRQQVLHRIPDVAVVGSWMWHASAGADLKRYERELRAFLLALTSQPSFKGWWGTPGRLVWRAALPTERATAHVQSSTRCAAANAVARRLIAELAPSIVWVQQDSLLSRRGLLRRGGTGDSASEPPTLALTKDGLHFHGPVQVLLMNHLLATIKQTLQYPSTASSHQPALAKPGPSR
jgi:hypothetical protein